MIYQRRITTVWDKTPIPQETMSAYQSGQAIDNPKEAVIAAQAQLRTSRFQPVGPLKIVSVDRMEFEEVMSRLSMSAEESSWDVDMDVWLLEMQGDWELSPPNGEIEKGSGRFYVVLPADGKGGIMVKWGVKE